MAKKIIDAQNSAQKYLEDEILKFEVRLLKVTEKINNESEIIINIICYLESLYDDFDIHDYSEIHKDIQQYNSDVHIDHNNVYFRLLEKKFAEARISSLNAMLDLCNGKSFKYKINDQDLDVHINDFKFSDTIQKLVHISGHKKDITLKIQSVIYKLAQVTKEEFENQEKKLNKKKLAWEVHNRINNVNYKNQIVKDANLTVENIERKYLNNWKDI